MVPDNPGRRTGNWCLVLVIIESFGGQSGFQLKFRLGKGSTASVAAAVRFFDPRTRVIIAVTVNGATEVLMDGIITKQDVTSSNAAGQEHS